MAKVKRLCQGHYTVSTSVRSGGYVVNVTFTPQYPGWIAAACWDRHRYTDPLRTKREAVREAHRMINNALKADADRMIAQTHAIMDRINAQRAACHGH